MNSGAITLLSFSAAALAAAGLVSVAFDLVWRDRSRIVRRLDDEFGATLKRRARRSALFKTLDPLTDESTGGAPTAHDSLQAMIQQAGLSWTVEHFVSLSLCIGTVTVPIVYFLVERLWAGLVIGLIAAAAPLLYLCVRRNKRQQRLCEQLPEAFELMSRAVRAGQTMDSAFQLLAQEGKPPLSEEFAYCCEQQNLGLSHDLTLRDLASRNKVMELQMFAVAMLVQRQSGGNPVELLANLSDVIRKRMRLVGKVKALTGEGRLQAIVLTVLPIAAFVALLAINRDYAQELLDRPMLLVGALASQAIGAIWIRKIIRIEF
ncbi:MAG: type II secretion system F family protein [Planctomycetales bacterium]